MGFLFIPPPTEKPKVGKETGGAEAEESREMEASCSQPRQTEIYHQDEGAARSIDQLERVLGFLMEQFLCKDM